jgi:putative Ca2+/H+ antiporter (TMEM165/GDT1 family)
MDFPGISQPIIWNLFASTFLLIALAELPDKTALATLLMASRHHPQGVFTGVAGAFFVQTLVAVLGGSLLNLLPHWLVQLTAALMFLVFAAISWKHSNESEEKNETGAKAGGKSFWQAAGSAFLVIFIAEWGDLTQLATAALVAQTHEPLTIFLGALTGLLFSTALTVWLGTKAGKFIKPRPLQRAAAVVFTLIGLYLLWRLIGN